MSAFPFLWPTDMQLQTVLVFDNAGYYYSVLSRHDEKYIKGEIINGRWYFIFDVKAGKMYAATRLTDLTPENYICDAKLVDEVVYHKAAYREWLTTTELGNDYNAVIAWAQSVIRNRRLTAQAESDIMNHV